MGESGTQGRQNAPLTNSQISLSISLILDAPDMKGSNIGLESLQNFKSERVKFRCLILSAE